MSLGDLMAFVALVLTLTLLNYVALQSLTEQGRLATLRRGLTAAMLRPFQQQLTANRIRAIEEELPRVLDLSVLSLRSGTELFQGLRLIVSLHSSHPLSQELTLTLKHLDLGVPATQALRDLGQRVRSPALAQVCQAILLALDLGSPISEVLELQAMELDARRLSSMEVAAQKLPVKLMFPLLLLMLPVFALIFVPMFLRFSFLF